jgi:hypothetical protein
MNRLFCLLGLAGLLLAAGCRKDDLVDCAPTPPSPPTPPTPPTPPGPPTSNLSLADFCRRNRGAIQYFGFAPNQIKTISTAGGATLTFPGSAISYLLPTGLPTGDSILVRLREIYKVPDMVLNDMPTVAQNQQLLISGGEFSIQLVRSRSTDRVRAVAVGTSLISLRSPMPNPQDLAPQQLWQQPFTQGSLLGWQTSAVAPYPAVQIQSPFYQTNLPLDSLSWWNIDRIWPAYAGATLTPTVVEVPTASAVGETRVYLRPTGANGLARLSATGSTYTQWQANMPIGANMQAIVLQSLNGQLYFGTQLFTVQSGVVIKPPLTAVSEAAAVALIRQL